MTNIVFTLIVFAVNSFVFGSQSSVLAPLLPGRTASVQIMCEKDATDVNHSLLQRFNRLVGEYFQANFGDGGEKYLDRFEGCTDLADRRDFISEVEQIVHSFEGSWLGKKKTDDVRFRLHRFLGILMLYKQNPSAVGRGFVVDVRGSLNVDVRKPFVLCYAATEMVLM